MPHRQLAHAERVAIVERHLAGEPLDQIAAALQISWYTARTYWRRYRDQGWAALALASPGPPATGPLGTTHPRVKYVALRLKRQHRAWGVDKLRLELTRRASLHGLAIPRRSALAAYLAQFGARLTRPRHRRMRRPEPPPRSRPTAPHQCWQIDFKGDEPVDGVGARIAPLMVCDTASGAPLAGRIHQVARRGSRRGLTTRLVQRDLRRVFAQWGLPDAVRMDRDSVFIGSTRQEWPGLLLLWLIGLGIQPLVNRAYHPTDNAIVERNHQTWTAHVLVEQAYASLDAIQTATDQAFADRRQLLPSRHRGCAGQPFAVAFPELGRPRRAYTPAQEPTLFDLARVDQFLAQWRWERTVDSRGQISLNDRGYVVGPRAQHTVVRIQFDPAIRQCVVRQVDGTILTQIHIPGFERAYLLGDIDLAPLAGG